MPKILYKLEFGSLRRDSTLNLGDLSWSSSVSRRSYGRIHVGTERVRTTAAEFVPY